MKVAVIGIRGMGKTHLQALKKCKLVRDVAGCDLDATVRAAVGRELAVRTFADVAALLREYRPDAVVIATPPNTHGQVARACLEQGVALLTEKPICSTLQESAELVELAERKNVPFQCGFELRYCGSIRAVQSLLDAGELGRLTCIGLVQISGSHTEPGYMSRARTGGIFYEKLCHQVDLFRFFFGEPRRVMAIAAPQIIQHYEIEDNVLAVFEFAAGALGTIKFDTRRAAQINGLAQPEQTFEGRAAGHFYELTFSGDRGTAVYDAWTETVDLIKQNQRPDRKAELARRINIQEEFGRPSYDVDTQNADFLQNVKAGKPVRYPARDALKTMTWVERAEESLRRHGEWLGA